MMNFLIVVGSFVLVFIAMWELFAWIDRRIMPYPHFPHFWQNLNKKKKK